MTWKMHEIQFPRYDADIRTEHRTLFHLPLDADPVAPGDGLLLRSSNSPRCKLGVITDVRELRLRDELDADLGALAATDRDEYLARWDALHPELPSEDDPAMWRVAFRYVRVDGASIVSVNQIAERGVESDGSRAEVEQLQGQVAEIEAKIAGLEAAHESIQRLVTTAETVTIEGTGAPLNARVVMARDIEDVLAGRLR